MSDEPPRILDETPRTYEVKTHGCQMNVHDSERLSGLRFVGILGLRPLYTTAMETSGSTFNVIFSNDKGGTLSDEDKNKFEAALNDTFGDTDITTDIDVTISY